MSAPAAPLQLRLCMFLNYCAYAIQLNSVGIAVLQTQRSFGVSLVEASTLAFYKGLGILSGALIAGSFLKRIGYKRAMLIALAASALVLVAVPVFVSFTAVKAVFLVTGLSYGLMKVALYSTIGLISPGKKEHASLLSFVESFYKIGSLLTFIVFAAFTNNNDPHSTSWSYAYTLLAGLMAVAFVLLVSTPLDESSVREDSAKPLYLPFLEMARLAITPVAVTLAFLVFAAIVTEHGFINWLPTFNTKVMGLVPTLGIQLAGLYAIFAIIGRVGVGFVLKRVAWFPVLVACIAGAAGVLVLGLLAARGVVLSAVADWREVPLAVWLLPLTGLFVGPIWPVMHSAALTTLPAARHNTLASLSVVFSSTSGAVGTPLLGVVFHHYGGLVALAALLVPLAILAMGIVVLRRVKQAMPAASPA
ncbi:MFS transporter [Oleiharenicola lentus]|uniref:MFS transporter n=1 Tax=Oleiharenicola lentus TaxID=2508720 RepID=A0A4Q1C5F6_9BACT|nr:MFS transporter [Oleiharenicola lentus]RXK53674.1 MFS transporter [Oleiharenicola lentus]